MCSSPRNGFVRALRGASLALACALPGAGAHADPAVNVPVIVHPGEQTQPVMVSDGQGGAILAWQDHRSGEADIHAQRIGPDGTPQWAADGVAICTVTGFQTQPRITSDGAGGAIIVWTDYRSVDGDVYAQRVSPNGSTLWISGGVPLCDDTEPQLGVEIVADGSGGVIAVWEDFRAGSSGDLFAQRVLNGGSPAWAANGVPVTVAAGAQGEPALAADGAGGAIVVWRDLGASADGDLRAQRIDPGGGLDWSADGVSVCDAAGAQYDVQAVPDGSYGVVVVWADERSAFLPNIYAQRLGPTGLALWTEDGVQAAPGDAFQLFPVAAPDGAGGVVLAWEDYGGATVDVYGQRIRSDGTRSWTVTGLRLCDANGYESVPAIVGDGAGGGIFVWQDARGDDEDLYAQHVTAAGSRQWGPLGTAVSTASGTQLSPAIAPDGLGGALFAWCDDRGADLDIYADHLAGQAPPVGLVPAPQAGELRLSPPAPNPSRGFTRLHFRLPAGARVRIDVFDPAGRLVHVQDAGVLAAGAHSVSLALDPAGHPAAGLHFVRLTAGGRSAVTRLLILP